MSDENEEFPVYKSKDVPFSWRSPKDINTDAVLHTDGRTRFQQGELGDCWLVAAIESLRHQVNQESFNEVVQAHGNDLEFRWVGSYEGLEGGFWTDAIQSFTGGVVERIKLREGNIPENLFEIMLNSYRSGSFLCCIKKDPHRTEKYHSCCIDALEINEDNSEICVRDPYSQEYNFWTYEQFINEYHRLDMCHKNLDNLSALWGKNIGSCPWESQNFSLQLESLCDEFSIILTDTDDDQEGCTFVVELVQKIKPDEGEELEYIRPWDALVHLELEVGEEIFPVKFPQETRCFTLEPGTHDIRVTTNTEQHSKIYMRIFSKRMYEVERK
ncbi:calpain-9 isoform X3 [Cryptotermes secundus]|uniref:calpain-9 isoform X3 n=1 Tax=Cryptotermes secundus TaxID=105785 RepID=UPI000CD7ABA6|nr:calpain-9 isoform X3 [Cryptotermes secundus]